MFPPPMTMAISTPSCWISLTSLAIWAVTAGSIPYCFSPMRASPDSLRRTRLYVGSDSEGIRTGIIPGLFPDLEPREAAHGDVLTGLCRSLRNELRDRHARFPRVGLVHQDDLRVERSQLAL